MCHITSHIIYVTYSFDPNKVTILSRQPLLDRASELHLKLFVGGDALQPPFSFSLQPPFSFSMRWFPTDVLGLFSIIVVSFSLNVVQNTRIFSINLVPKPRMFSVPAVYVLSPLHLSAFVVPLLLEPRYLPFSTTPTIPAFSMRCLI